MPQGVGAKGKPRRTVRGVPAPIERAVLKTLRSCRVEPAANYLVEQPRPRLRTATHRQIAPPDDLFRGSESVKMAYLPYVTTVGTARGEEEVGISIIRVNAFPGTDANAGIKFKLSSSKTYRCGRGNSEIASLVVRHASQDSEISSRQVFSLRFYHEDGVDGCLVLRLNENFRKRMVLASASELPDFIRVIPTTVCNHAKPSAAARTPKELEIINFLLGDQGVAAATQPSQASAPQGGAAKASPHAASASLPARPGRSSTASAKLSPTQARGQAGSAAEAPHHRDNAESAPGRRPGTRAHSRQLHGAPPPWRMPLPVPIAPKGAVRKRLRPRPDVGVLGTGDSTLSPPAVVPYAEDAPPYRRARAGPAAVAWSDTFVRDAAPAVAALRFGAALGFGDGIALPVEAGPEGGAAPGRGQDGGGDACSAAGVGGAPVVVTAPFPAADTAMPLPTTGV